MHGLDHLKPKNDPSLAKPSFDSYRKAKPDEEAIKCIIIHSRPFGDFRRSGRSLNLVFSLVFLKLVCLSLCSEILKCCYVSLFRRTIKYMDFN